MAKNIPNLDNQIADLASAPSGASINVTFNTHNGWHTRRPLVHAYFTHLVVDVGGREVTVLVDDITSEIEHDYVRSRRDKNQLDFFQSSGEPASVGI